MIIFRRIKNPWKFEKYCPSASKEIVFKNRQHVFFEKNSLKKKVCQKFTLAYWRIDSGQLFVLFLERWIFGLLWKTECRKSVPRSEGPVKLKHKFRCTPLFPIFLCATKIRVALNFTKFNRNYYSLSFEGISHSPFFDFKPGSDWFLTIEFE